MNLVVRFEHEISIRKDAKPNHLDLDFVRYDPEFVITVIVINEFN